MKNELRFLTTVGFRPNKNEVDFVIPDFNKADLSTLEERPGAYVIVSQDQYFPYPGGESKIMYIGESDNLRRRLIDHYNEYKKVCGKQYSQSCPSRYYYIESFGAKVYCFYTRGGQTSKNLEADLIDMVLFQLEMAHDLSGVK